MINAKQLEKPNIMLKQMHQQ